MNKKRTLSLKLAVHYIWPQGLPTPELKAAAFPLKQTIPWCLFYQNLHVLPPPQLPLMSKHIKTFSTAVLSSKHIPPAWQVSAHFVPKARTVTEGLCSGQCKLISVFLNGMNRTPEINLDTLTFFSLIMFVVSTITIISHAIYFDSWGLGETQTHL